MPGASNSACIIVAVQQPVLAMDLAPSTSPVCRSRNSIVSLRRITAEVDDDRLFSESRKVRRNGSESWQRLSRKFEAPARQVSISPVHCTPYSSRDILLQIWAGSTQICAKDVQITKLQIDFVRSSESCYFPIAVVLANYTVSSKRKRICYPRYRNRFERWSASTLYLWCRFDCRHDLSNCGSLGRWRSCSKHST